MNTDEKYLFNKMESIFGIRMKVVYMDLVDIFYLIS